jgi:thiol peroxidase
MATTLAGSDLSDASSKTYAGSRVVLDSFPGIGTATYAASVCRFDELATGLDHTVVGCASADLPYGMRPFCGAEGIANVTVGSAFRSSSDDAAVAALG